MFKRYKKGKTNTFANEYLDKILFNLFYIEFI